MKIISTITDKAVLGTEGLSRSEPRYTARAIVKNADGLYAVMYAKKFDLYSLPGGGVEGEESPLNALHREILEETGCTCDKIEELGIIYENRFHADYTQYSYYYVVEASSDVTNLSLTGEEAANGTGVQWHTLEKVFSLISEPTHTTTQRKFLQARDVAALRYYLSHGGKNYETPIH